jgi:hypothetical protein
MEMRGAFHNKKKLAYFGVFIIILLFLGVFFLDDSSSVFTAGASVIGMDDVYEDKLVSFNADVVLTELDLKGAFVSVTIVFNGTNNDLYIKGDPFTFEDARSNEVVLNGYQGRIRLTQTNSLLLDGKAESVTLGGFTHTANKPFSVSTDNLYFDTLEATEILTKSFGFSSKGTLEVDESKMFNLAYEQVDLGVFAGNLMVDARELSISGATSGLSIEGVADINPLE